MITITVPSEFGYIPLVMIASYGLTQYLAINVARARKKYDVKYPIMYSDKEPMFNCIQRAHQQTLEDYPTFLMSLLLGGLQYPRVCAVSGAIWIVARVFFAKGYYTGMPEKRQRGAFGWIALQVNHVCSVLFGLHVLGWM